MKTTAAKPLRVIDTHRGVHIQIWSDGTFRTSVDDEVGELSATDLGKLKKLIDDAGKVKRERVPAFRLEGSWRTDHELKIHNVTVTSVIVGGMYGRDAAWISDKTGGREKVDACNVYKDTPANREKAERYIEMKRSINKLEEQAEKVLQGLVHFATTKE